MTGPSGTGRHGRAVRVGAMLLLTAVLLMAAFGAVGAAAAAPIPAPTHVTATAAAPAVPPSSPAPPVGIPPGPVTTSGPGTFYSSVSLPNAAFNQQTCVSGSCYNISNDVSVNYTSRGLLAAVYTSLTNQSPCLSMRASSVSNIAFVTSTSQGASWSAPQYLGNPVCTGGSAGYSDAWQPTITSLANGTLVLAYVEYNLSAGQLPPLDAFSWPPTQSRLVLTESYDNGASWTTPQVLNISNPPSAPPGLQFTPAVPSVTAFGNTIYLTWMSLMVQNSLGSIALLVSSTGGATWSPTIPISTGYGAYYSMNPQVTTDSNGRLFIAYTSNVSQDYFFCGLEGCNFFSPPVWVGSVWVANSYSNGTVFNYSEVADQVPLGTPSWAPWSNPAVLSEFETPAPQIVTSEATGQVYVAFTAGSVSLGQFACFNGAAGCLVNTPFFFSSSDDGATWVGGNIGTVVLDPTTIDPTSGLPTANNSLTTLAIAQSNGTVYVEAGFYNGSVCFATGGCGAQTEVVFSTSDNGTTFTTPAVAASGYTPTPFAWGGEYSAVLVVNGTPQFYWTSNECPGYLTTPCTAGYPVSSLPAAGIEMSTPFTGAGVTLSFVAAKLNPTYSWTVNVLGNIRGGLGSQTLSVSGVPTGVPILWAASNSTAPGYEFLVGSTTPSAPAALTGNLTVTVNYDEFVSLQISYTVPNFDSPACSAYGFASCPPSFYPGCIGPPGVYPYPIGNFMWGCFDKYFTPVPPTGEQWVPYGSLQTISLSPTPQYGCGYPWGGYFGYVECFATMYNTSFGGWSGSGLGSVSSSTENISFYPLGPVIEHATFFITQACTYEFEVFGATIYIFIYSCAKFTSTLTVQETGLPAGDTWGVTLAGAAGSGTAQTTAGGQIVNSSASVGIGSVTPWNVPSATPGMVWVGTIAGGDAVVLPHTAPVDVQYTLESEANLTVPVTVQASGLPRGMSGNVTLTDTSTAAVTDLSPSPNGTSTTLPAGTYVVKASTIDTTTGTSYVPAEVYASVALVNASNQSGLSPATIVLDGGAYLTIAYTPEYWVQVSASLGGSASPASQFVVSGRTITLTATPSPGYVFVDWFGTGPGSATGPQALQPTITLQPAGPLTEVAVFEPPPPAQYTVHVVPSGLPGGQLSTVELGSRTYSGAGPFTIGNLSAGVYSLAFPDVTGVGAAISRYVESSVTASSGLGSGTLDVTTDINLTVAYTTQYYVSLAAVGSGSLSTPPGAFWQDANALLTITATPATGWLFANWLGSVDGSASAVLSTSPTLQLTLSGSAALVAQFSLAPPVVPPSYDLTVTESGLLSGSPWQFALSPGYGASGVGATLVSSGLNGAYTLTVPTVYLGAGVRFVPVSNASVSLTITTNTAVTVAFQEQFLVSVSAAATGYPSTTTDSWVPATTSFSLQVPAAPAAGLVFLGWQGSGVGNYTGSNATASITPRSAVTETALFGPPAARSATAPVSLADWAMLGGLTAVLVAVGIAEGISIGRRRRRPPAAAAAPVVDSTMYSGSAPAPSLEEVQPESGSRFPGEMRPAPAPWSEESGPSTPSSSPPWSER